MTEIKASLFPLSVEMRTQKALDHFQFGVCGESALNHDRLVKWIARAEELEAENEAARKALLFAMNCDCAPYLRTEKDAQEQAQELIDRAKAGDFD